MKMGEHLPAAHSRSDALETADGVVALPIPPDSGHPASRPNVVPRTHGLYLEGTRELSPIFACPIRHLHVQRGGARHAPAPVGWVVRGQANSSKTAPSPLGSLELLRTGLGRRGLGSALGKFTPPTQHNKNKNHRHTKGSRLTTK